VNAMAARNGTLIELMDPRYVNGCYYALADSAGLDYWLSMAEPAEGAELRVDVSRLAATLEAAL
jgi:hypothetical protein